MFFKALWNIHDKIWAKSRLLMENLYSKLVGNIQKNEYNLGE